LIDYFLKHDEQREEIARRGYQFVHSNRTYDVVIDEIISRIENDRGLQ
jgi:spore maturation protein CgeB